MKLFALCFVALFAGSLASLATEQNDEDRVLKGKPAKIEDFPYVLRLRWTTFTRCAATLISAHTAITAATCLEDHYAPEIYNVVAGEAEFGKGSAQQRALTKYLEHTDFDKEVSSDIALLFWKVPLRFSETVSPIALPSQDSPVPFGHNGTLAGFGALEANEGNAGRLHFAVVRPVADKVCKQAHEGKTFKTGLLCATEAAAEGDRGGALVVHRVLVGVLSWHKDYNKPGLPNVYARIGKYRKWIHENIEL